MFIFYITLLHILYNTKKLCAFFTVLYSGTLTAFLAIPVFQKPVDNLNDLLAIAQEEGYSPMMIEASSNEVIFRVISNFRLAHFYKLFFKSYYKKYKIRIPIVKIKSYHFISNIVLTIKIQFFIVDNGMILVSEEVIF